MHYSAILFLFLSILFCVPAYSQFADAVDLTTPRGAIRDVEITDIDGDGDPDVVTIQDDYFNPTSIDWYPNDGSGNFAVSVPVPNSIGTPQDIEIVDFNNDGSPDILASFPGAFSVAWFLNDGTGNFSLGQLLSDTIEYCRNAHAEDLDGDGDKDVLTVSNELGIFDDFSYLARFENLGGGNFGPAIRITTDDLEDPTDINAADLDGDGLVDVICASLNTDDINWYKNLGGGNFGPKINLPDVLVGAREVEIGDPDNDGDIDLLTASVGDNRVAWFENNGTGTFTLHQLSSVNSSVDDCQDVEFIDYDGDGDLDVAAALLDENAMHLFENLGGGVFGTFQELTTRAFGGWAIDGADLDNDGITDLVSGSQNDSKAAWYKGLGSGSFSEDLPISRSAGGANAAELADLDGDGDLDALSTSSLDDRLAWYENLGGNTFGPQQVISMDIFLCHQVVARDLNGDTYPDLVVGGDEIILTYFNDGSANFTVDTVTQAVDNPRGLIVEDLDGDGDADIASASWWDSKLAWYANDGSGNFGSQTVIDNVGGADALVAADWDGDSDMDLVVGNEFSDRYLYYENLGGGSFAAYQTLVSSVNGTFDATVGDANGDGNLDLIYCGFYANTVGYVPFSGGSWGTPQVITTALFNPYSVRAWDPDGDGDTDVLVPVFGENRFVSVENTGAGVFGPRREIYSVFERPNFALPGDVDGDGDEDMIGTFKNTVSFVENLRLALCDDQNPPTGLSSTVNASGATLNWSPITNSVACRVQGRPVGSPGFALLPPLVGPEPSSAFVSISKLSPGQDYEWAVRCACSLSPVTATPLSALDLFSVPLLRTGTQSTFFPNPASSSVQFAVQEDWVELYDLEGRQLIRAENVSSLGISDLPSGSYLLITGSNPVEQTLQIIR